jgi:preprotein translocase subunit SecB
VDPSKPPGIQVAQIFLQRAIFAHREDSLALPPTTPIGTPDITLTTTAGQSADSKRGIITLRVQTKPEQRPLYSLDIEMTALVEVQEGMENMPVERYIRVSGPAMVYPFIRQVVADLTSKGRFGPLWLNPVNFIAAAQTLRSAAGEPMIAYRAEPEPQPRQGKARLAKRRKKRSKR